MKHARSHTTRATAALSALALGTLLSACGVLGNKPAPQLTTYALEAAAPTAPTTAPSMPASGGMLGQRVLLVEVPHAAPGYDSTRMVYVRQPLTQEAFAHSVWTDTPARMLAPLLVDHLQHSGLFRAVLLAPSAAKAGLRLDTTILRLEQDFLQQPSTVRLRLHVTLVDNSTREVLASRTLEVVHIASSEDAAGGALATNAAVHEAMQQVAAYLQATLAALPVPQAGMDRGVSSGL